jgi:small subunit ribosomal protein S4
VRPGDTVELAENARAICASRPLWKPPSRAAFPEWIEVDAKAGKGVFKSYPARTDLPATINESLVVELYSR